MKRTKIIGAVSALAVGALLGVGTFALFSDTEVSGDQSLTAGTLDLTIGGPGESFGVTPISNLAPGASGSVQITLNNVGSVAGVGTASFVRTADAENSCTEPELASDLDGVGDVSAEPACAADLLGELDDNVQVSVTVNGVPGYSGGLSGLLGAGGNINLALAAANASGTDSAVVVLSYQLPATAGNDVQSDSFGIRVDAVLNQA